MFYSGLILVVSPVASAFPVFTVLLAKIFLKERIAFGQAAGIGSVIFGLVLLSV